jgi:predicted O-methyltransferase YrrM
VPSPYARSYDDGPHQRRARAALPFGHSAEFSAFIDSSIRAAEENGSTNGKPFSNPCALQPDTLGLLQELLNRYNSRAIVEFGSGASTELFAPWAALHGANFVSVEHDRVWVDDVRRRLASLERSRVDLRYMPLRFLRRGLRCFATYRDLSGLAETLRTADLVLIDGPHASGREPVLHAVLTSSRPGAVIIVDDFRHYAIRQMMIDVSPTVGACFSAHAVDDNAHGLMLLRCLRAPPPSQVPAGGPLSIARSYWRCFRDLREYGTGD